MDGACVAAGLWASTQQIVGVAAMLGDLAESLIKRDCQKKDASQAMPGSAVCSTSWIP